MYETVLSVLGADPTVLGQNLLLRAGLSAITAFAVTVLATRALLCVLLRAGVSERVDKTDSDELKELHSHKASTPTMGGVSMVVGLGVATVLWAPLSNPYISTGLLVILGFATLGFLDDWIKLTQEKKKGMSIRAKLGWQILLASAMALALYFFGRGPGSTVEVDIPILRSTHLVLPALGFLGFATLVMVASVNAVNFTDGLDGLASGCAVVTGATFAGVAYLAGDAVSAAGFGMPFVEGGSELAVLGAALAGTGLGFLWHNCFPARLFMGDTGSLALGSAIGFMAIAVKQELLLPIVGAVFVAEGLSVVLQIAWFRITGKRLFLIAPLHHRYQFLGWHETQITIRFWISSAVSAAVGAVALRM